LSAVHLTQDTEASGSEAFVFSGTPVRIRSGPQVPPLVIVGSPSVTNLEYACNHAAHLTVR